MTAIAEVLAGMPQAIRWQEELYKQLHRNPELSMQEVETAAEIERRLCEDGYAVQRVGGGVVGVLVNGDGPRVLFRADVDGLPVKEATGLEYASTKEQTDRDGVAQPVMHACGHDMHVVAGLGAAHLMSAARGSWSGTYVALFQPGEETAEGARSMVDDGLVDKVGPIDVALGQHVLTVPWAGQVGTAAGPVMSSAASMRIVVTGKGSHGSMPHLGIDPVLLASAIVVRLQGVVARELPPSEFGVVTVGSLQAGTKANIIPNQATLLVNIRAYSDDVREQLIAAVERIVSAECQASGCPQDPTFELYDSYPLTSNDADATARVTEAFLAHFGRERVTQLDPITASEDFSTIPAAFGAPSCYWGFGGFPEGSVVVPNHNPGFAPVIHPTLETGTEAAVAAALAWLGRDSA